MAIQLPTLAGREWYEFRITLDGVKYTVELRWNARSNRWTFSLRTRDGEPLLVGRRVVVGMPLLMRGTDPRMPPGDIIAVDQAGLDADPGRDDLGSRVLLMYVTANELAEA